MPRHHAPDDYEDDPNEPDESDWDDDEGDEEAETIDCPHCGESVYEGAEQCPHCGAYVSREDGRPERKPLWVIVAAVLALLAALLWML